MTPARAGVFAAALLAAATLYGGLHWGSTVGGGADSYGYVSQAGLWLQGRLSVQQEIVRASPWPLAIETWAPLGYRAAPDRPDEIVPLYAPGLPLLMALFQSIGGFCAAFVVIPASGALTIWLTYVLAQRMFGRPGISIAAAALVATSPIFLYQLMNPMTDVPVTAAWTLATVLATAGWPLTAGVAAGAAIIIRPNLAAIALALGVWLALAGGRPWRFAIGVAPAIFGIAAVNRILYGAPWVSGYGTLPDLYSAAHWLTNTRQFTRWLLETQTAIVVLALLFFVTPRRFPQPRIPQAPLLAGGVLAATVLSYIFYIPFDAWWYLRFLLPMWPMLMLLLAASLHAVMARVPRRVATVAFAAVAVAIAVNNVRIAAARAAFDVGRGERRYIDIARFVATHTEPEAVVLAVQHSGTLRMYASRLTLRFDQLDAVWLDRVVEFLQTRGRHPYIVLEGDEVAQFTARFSAANAAGRLDWRPLAAFASPPILVFDAVNRSGNDEPLAIAAAASRRVGWRCDPPQDWPTPLRMK